MGSRLDPLSRRLLGLAGLLSVLLIAVVVNYLLHDASEALNPIADAAQRTAAMPGARLKIEVTYGAEGSSKTVTGTGDGVYDARTGRTDARLTISTPGGGSTWVEALGDERTVYTRSSALESVLPPGKLWVGMEPLLGHDPQNALGSGSGAQGTLEELKAAGGSVEELDHQIVRGHRTTRYKSTIDLARVADLLGEGGDAELTREYEVLAEKSPDPIPVEVWIDEHGLARLVRMVQQLPTVSGGPTISMDTRMEFFDFGHQSKIPLPPKSRVLDYTPVLRAELGLEDGTSFGPLSPPPGAKPLSASAFRHRATQICGRAYDEAKSIAPTEQRFIRQLKGLGRSAILAGEGKPILVGLGRWIEGPLYRLGRRETRELASLAPPPSDLANFHRYLTLDVKSLEGILAGARAFQLGLYKVPGPADRKAEESRQKSERKHLVAALGIPVCEKEFKGSDSATEPA
jgi:hypothetical protein